MKIFLNSDGAVDFDEINNNSTVDELLDAIDIFLKNNPLPCGSCDDSCCKKSWSVEMDNVCVNRLCSWNKDAAIEFVQDKLMRKMNYFKDFYQYVLRKDKECTFVTKDNWCTIYEARPIICRLYICSKKSQRYNILREIIGCTYLSALVAEYKINSNKLTERAISRHRENPAVFAKGYDIYIEDIINYAETQGWLDPDERELLYNI